MVTFFLDTGKESGEDGFMVYGFALPQVLQINHEYGFLQSSVGETNILIGCRVWLHEVDATSLDGGQVIGFHSETPDLADKEGAVVKASDQDKHLVHGVHLVYQVQALEHAHEEQLSGIFDDAMDICVKL
ncbi:Os08g0440450 [Oryza sativa Japonica Group]|uniref:Os08g0440450 protein n=1 Tax=Oryza sativa subsp. japonica TaxID=39947 RepID=A0A0P0XG97_ORYSJ|nr:Os08g0440450 [Oryza sativa Japonica Group]